MFNRHKHNWNLISETLVESPYTRTVKLLESTPGASFKGGEIWDQNSYYNDKFVLVFKCECGDVKVVER